MKYFVTLGERTMVVEIDGDAIQVDGQSVSASLEALDGSPEVRLVIEGRAATLAVEGHGDGVWRLVDRGAVREVGVEDERTRHIRQLAGAGKAANSGAVVKAPMPGLVVRIPVTVGEQVGAGAGLLVLEAMKMENEIKAAGPGVVSAIRVATGQAVEKGQILIELGPVA
jgi:pyruvate carboxylase subunit B